jgi:hypothetical protein
MNNQYTGAFAPQQNGLQQQAPQMAPQNPNYGQQLGAMLARPAPSATSMPDMASLMQMMGQIKGMQQPVAQQPLAPVYDHSFPSAG